VAAVIVETGFVSDAGDREAPRPARAGLAARLTRRGL